MTSVLDRMLQTRYVPDKEKFAAHREYMMQRAKQKALAKKEAQEEQNTEQTLEQKMQSLKETVNTLLYQQNTTPAEDTAEDVQEPADTACEEAYTEKTGTYDIDTASTYEDDEYLSEDDACYNAAAAEAAEDDKIEDTPMQDAVQSKEETPSFENNIQFGVRLRGYDREEVDNYIAALTQDYNTLCEELELINNENALLCKGFLTLMQQLPQPQEST